MTRYLRRCLQEGDEADMQVPLVGEERLRAGPSTEKGGGVTRALGLGRRRWPNAERVEGRRRVVATGQTEGEKGNEPEVHFLFMISFSFS
jgi:hypothetical protein